MKVKLNETQPDDIVTLRDGTKLVVYSVNFRDRSGPIKTVGGLRFYADGQYLKNRESGFDIVSVERPGVPNSLEYFKEESARLSKFIAGTVDTLYQLVNKAEKELSGDDMEKFADHMEAIMTSTAEKIRNRLP